MTLDEELAAAQLAAGFLPAPQGPRYVKALGRFRAALPRLERDSAPLLDFLKDLLPVVRKHWPSAGPAVNDLLPIIEGIVEDLTT